MRPQTKKEAGGLEKRAVWKMNMVFVLVFDLLLMVAITTAAFTRKVLYEGTDDESDLRYLHNELSDFDDFWD